jgi:hypothetical protein
MKRIVIPTLFASATALALWQAQAIRGLEYSRDELNRQLGLVRTSLQTQEDALANDRRQLAQIRDRQSRQQTQADTETAALPTPKTEGWWPQQRPYFYLSKTMLPLVRFRDFQLPKDEVARTPEMKAGAGEGHDSYDFHVPFMEGDQLNPIVGSLFGMTEEEFQHTGDTCSKMVREFHDLEASKLQPVDPPEPRENGGAIIARIPKLTDEVTPLLDSMTQVLTTQLGEDRAQVIGTLATSHFNVNEDCLGSKPREFIYQDNSISICFIDAWGGRSSGAITWYCPPEIKAWRYDYLFPNGVTPKH